MQSPLMLQRREEADFVQIILVGQINCCGPIYLWSFLGVLISVPHIFYFAHLVFFFVKTVERP